MYLQDDLSLLDRFQPPPKSTSSKGSSSSYSGMGSLLSIAMLWRIQHAMVIVQTLSCVILTSECITWKRRFKMPNALSMMDLVIRRARLNLLWEGFTGFG